MTTLAEAQSAASEISTAVEQLNAVTASYTAKLEALGADASMASIKELKAASEAEQAPIRASLNSAMAASAAASNAVIADDAASTEDKKAAKAAYDDALKAVQAAAKQSAALTSMFLSRTTEVGQSALSRDLAEIKAATTSSDSTVSTAAAAGTAVSAAEKDSINAAKSATDKLPSGAKDALGKVTNKKESAPEAAANPTEVVVTAKRPAKQVVVNNPLHDYESYTYNLSLHVLSQDDYNKIVENPTKAYIPNNVLVASAGRVDAALFKRNPHFTEDFFFEDFKMTTYVAPTTRNRNSNLIECSFTLIEPTGFTFVNRLMAAVHNSAAQGGVGGLNYSAHPYVIQLDYFGYKDGAPTHVKDQTKVFPIILTGIKSKITTRGSEYKITAVPYNHQSYQEKDLISPANFQIKAKTVQDVFGTGSVNNTVVAKIDQSRQEKEKQDRLKAAVASGGLDPSDLADTQKYLKDNEAKQIGSVTYTASGFTDGLNSWYTFLKNNKSIIEPNTYSVEFHPDIKNCKILSTTGPGPVQQATANAGDDAAQKASQQSKGVVSFDGININVPAGTGIDKLIDWAVRNSDYIGDQITDPTLKKSLDGASEQDLADKLKKPLQWFKIIPKIKIKGYDAARARYALDITYYVKPHTVYSKHPMAPTGKVEGFVKEYNYIYTGKNVDVLDMQLDFDVMYYVQMTGLANKGRGEETGAAINDPQVYSENDGTPATNSSGGKVLVPPSSKVQPTGAHHVSSDKRYSTRSGADQEKAVHAGDIQQNLYANSRGDMINLKLKIIGDPTLIKQDDIFYNQSNDIPATALTPNKSLWMDTGELYVKVNFRSPLDYSATTGLADPNSNNAKDNPYSYSAFSGTYKVITIDNVFAKGRFEQTLDLVRLPLTEDESAAIGQQSARPAAPSGSAAKSATGDLGKAAGSVGAAVSSATGAVQGAVGSVTKAVSGAVDSAKGAVSGAVDSAKSAVTGAITGATSKIGGLGSSSGLGISMSDVMDKGKSAVSGLGLKAPSIPNLPFSTDTAALPKLPSVDSIKLPDVELPVKPSKLTSFFGSGE